MNKPEIHFRSHSQSGNIFYILGLVRNALQKQHRITDYNNLRDQVFTTGSYKESLEVIRKTVTLIDDDGKY